MTSIVPRWKRNSGAVTRYWKRRWTGSLTRISSGIGIPAPVVITRDDPSTTHATMPGEPLGQPRGIADERPHVVGRAGDADLVADRAEHPADPTGRWPSPRYRWLMAAVTMYHNTN